MSKPENLSVNLNAQESADNESLVKRVRSRFKFLGDVDLPQPPREPGRELPEISVFENEDQNCL